MKVKNITKEDKTFDPITIEVVIENQMDLADLWHRLNAGAYTVHEGSDKVTPNWRAGPSGNPLWVMLDDIARERGFI